MDTNRRMLGTMLATASAGALLASCTQAQWDQIEQQFAEVITKVQQGVKDACATAGVLVPTANSVLAVLLSILGTTSVTGVTLSVIQQAINFIAGVACPPAPTAKKAAPGGTISVVINGKNVPVVFY